MFRPGPGTGSMEGTCLAGCNLFIQSERRLESSCAIGHVGGQIAQNIRLNDPPRLAR